MNQKTLKNLLTPNTPAKALLAVFLIALAYRLWGVTNPLLDFHSWRQTLTATIAMNFYTGDMNIFNPVSNLVKPYYAYEFHFYTFIVALLYKVFGSHDIFGRLVAILFSLGSMWMLYLLIKMYFDQTAAIIGIAFFAVLPMSVYYGRTFMPEAAMLFFSIALIYSFSLWLESDRWLHFFATVFCAAMVFLIKLPTLYLGGPLLFLAWMKYQKKIFIQPKLYLFAFMSLIPAILWYGYCAKLQSEAYGGSNLWLDLITNWDRLSTLRWYNLIFWTRLVEKMFAFTAFPFLVLGFIAKVEKPEDRMFHVWFLSVCVYFFIAAELNFVHEYYQVPIIPVGCVFIGKFLADFWKKNPTLGWKRNYKVWLVLLMITFIPIHSIYKLNKRLRYNNGYLTLGEKIKEFTGANDLIVAQEKFLAENGSPQLFYFSTRKGWIHGVNYILSPEKLKGYISEGAGFYITISNDLKKTNPELNSYLSEEHQLEFKDERMTLFRLNPS
jgi:4-amino-4-deoxy-L-arabinose transferase-like glycosyltransferase